ncbi:hypothetical protein [Bradyrhizobium yuanmingense]|uniref:hypothetical protein n=1 Tax=Bradyrhizobium yuanmingense TaxID=108015 RepID=UPI0023B98F9F|nr:hypothetical protein [Bradyrhizobium yuanmingense]MDF0584174.1 hypothetical protein [Bradyrhizobium yuanmingense]
MAPRITEEELRDADEALKEIAATNRRAAQTAFDNHAKRAATVEPLPDIDKLKLGPRDEFLKGYLTREKHILGWFGSLFYWIMGLSILASAVPTIILVLLMSEASARNPVAPAAFYNLVSLAVQYGIIFFVAKLCADLVWLRSAKLENEALNAKADVERLLGMQKDIEKKVEERAAQIKAGDNAIIVLNSTTGNIEQTIETRQDMRDPLALLIAYAEQSGRQDAIEASKKIAEEAGKAQPDKSEVFKLWNTVVAAIPKIGDVIEVTKMIMKLVSATG